MAEDKRLRDNRLALLGEIHGLFSQVADFSRVMVADFSERANFG
jgi:glycyl-tRNA synthetase beta subunit